MKKRSFLHTIQTIPLKLRIYRLVRQLIIWFLFASAVNLLFSYILYTPKSYLINQENKALVTKINDISEKLKEIDNSMGDIGFRDRNVYRAMFGLPEQMESDQIIEYSDQKYDYLSHDRYRDFLLSTWSYVDEISQKVVAASFALDTVCGLVEYKDRMQDFIPSIMPINKRHLKKISDYFGYRIHPVHKRRIFHEGVDLSCNRNTPVYAPADGIVVSAGYKAGYGRILTIDHGFGYVTRYGHLNSFTASIGQSVKRGEQVALSGNSGTSTGPHVHYEIFYNRKLVDPMNYMSKEISSEEYAKIIEEAKGADLTNNITRFSAGDYNSSNTKRP